ncbi:MAG: hypothetical protein QOF73_2470 [Thermomicrobiales bacterium]|nr:hypothetical protein [Thermomicrobiales bacterium]
MAYDYKADKTNACRMDVDCRPATCQCIVHHAMAAELLLLTRDDRLIARYIREDPDEDQYTESIRGNPRGVRFT